MPSLQGGPSRIGTPAPLSPLPTTGNLDHLVSMFHQTATDLGLPAEGFPPITPANISTLSIGEQMLLPLLCTSLQSSVHIATALENLLTEIHDLSSQIANLDFSPQPPNLAPLQASLRDIPSRLPSAAQAPFPRQHPGVSQQTTPSSSGSRPTPTGNTNPARQEKGKERAPSAPPPPPPNTVWPSPAADPDLPRYDMSTSPPTLYGNPEAFAKKYPHTWQAEEFAKGKYPPAPPGPPVILTPTGVLPPPWPPKPPPPTLKLSHPLLRERRVDRRRPLPRLPPLQLRRVRFLRNLPLLSPKLSADFSPPEPPSNPTQRRSREQPISQTLLLRSSEKPIALSQIVTKQGRFHMTNSY